MAHYLTVCLCVCRSLQIDKLVDESADAISFVINQGLLLHDAIQLGGHRAPRTHRLQGMPIGAALMKTLAAAAGRQENIHVVTGAAVSRLCFQDTEGRRRVTGVVYTQARGEGGEEGEEEEEVEVELPAGAVVLATGGAACDMDPEGLMHQYAPQLMGRATSSGAQANGKGIKLAKAVRRTCVNCYVATCRFALS
jgi:aspartate oxidase